MIKRKEKILQDNIKIAKTNLLQIMDEREIKRGIKHLKKALTGSAKIIGVEVDENFVLTYMAGIQFIELGQSRDTWSSKEHSQTTHAFLFTYLDGLRKQKSNKK